MNKQSADWWVPTGSPLLRLFMLISGLFYSAETSIITYHLWSMKNSKYLTLSEKLLVCFFTLGINWLLTVCVLVAVDFVTTVRVMLGLSVRVCVICRHFEHSVLARWAQRSVCFLQSHYHSGKISEQVRLSVCRCVWECYVCYVCLHGLMLTFCNICKWWVNIRKYFLPAKEM